MSLRTRLLLSLLGIGAVALVVLSFVAWNILAAATRSAKAVRLEDSLKLLCNQARLIKDPVGANDLCNDAAKSLDVRVTFVAKDGSVLCDSSISREQIPTIENHGDRPEIVAARVSGAATTERLSSTTGVEYLYFARKVGESAWIDIARIGLPMDRVEAFERRHFWMILLAIGGGFLVMAGVALASVLRLVRPIERMTHAAESVANGDLTVSVPEPAEDELFRLAAAVNGMKGTLVGKLQELDIEKRLLRAIQDGMEEGLLLVGADGRVLQDNPAFRRIFRVHGDPVLKPLTDSLRHPDVLSALERAAKGDDDVREAVRGTPGSDRSFEVHARRVDVPGSPGSRGVLMLFFDITRLEALEGMRQQFVADVSHELRTPVTSIKGALETLRDLGLATTPESQRFLDMAEKQSDRMRDLISDLMDLAMIETGGVRLELGSVEIAEVVDDVLDAIRQRHHSLDVLLESEVKKGVCVQADRRRLEQVLINLVDNAVKFNRPKGRVVVDAKTQGEVVVISVTDTGVGIPEEAIEKVFQRFYRVDRARARSAGGTGLGLAIVKHLVHLHEGEVRVTSTPGVGSRFEVILLAAR